jgi:hypothetical protein
MALKQCAPRPLLLMMLLQGQRCPQPPRRRLRQGGPSVATAGQERAQQPADRGRELRGPVGAKCAQHALCAGLEERPREPRVIREAAQQQQRDAGRLTAVSQ